MYKLLTILLIALIFVMSQATLAGTAQQTATDELNSAAGNAGLQGGDAAQSVGQIISIVLSILGLVMLIIVVYAGINWITKAGESEEVKKSKTMIIEGIIGLAICLSAYAITNYVVGKIGG